MDELNGNQLKTGGKGAATDAASGASHETSASPAAAEPGLENRPNIRRMLRDIAIDAGVPFGCYWLSMACISHSLVVALILASVFPLLKSVYELLHKRRLDPISLAILLGLIVGLGALFLGGSPKLLLLRESLFTGTFGLVCLVSLVFRSRRPLMFFFARYSAAGSDPALCAWYDRLWENAGFRRMQRIITLVWGLVLVGEFTLRVILIYTVSPATVLAVSPAVVGIASLLTVIWTMRYGKRAGKALARHN